MAVQYINDEIVTCPHCGAEDLVKKGRRVTKITYQRFVCKNCKRSFSVPIDNDVISSRIIEINEEDVDFGNIRGQGK